MTIIAGVNTDDPAVIAMARKYAAEPDSPAEDKGPYGDLAPKKYEPVKYDPNDPKIIALAKTINAQEDASQEAELFSQGVLDTFKAGLPAPLMEAVAPGSLLASFKGDQSDSENILKSAYGEVYLGWKRLAEKMLGRDTESEGTRRALQDKQTEFDQKYPSGYQSAQKELYKLMIGLSTLAVPSTDILAGAGIVSKVAGMMPKGLQTATKIAGLGVASAPANAILGAAYAQPEEDLGSAAERSAVISILANSAIASAFSAPSMLLGRQTADKAKRVIKKLMSQVKDVNVLKRSENFNADTGKVTKVPEKRERTYAPIIGGDVTENQNLLNFQEHVLAPYGLGGQMEQFEKVKENVDALAEDLFESSGGSKALNGYEADDLIKNFEKAATQLNDNAEKSMKAVSPENYSGAEQEQILQNVQETAQKWKDQKDEMYEKAGEAFSESGVPFDPTIAMTQAKSMISDELEYSQRFEGDKGLMDQAKQILRFGSLMKNKSKEEIDQFLSNYIPAGQNFGENFNDQYRFNRASQGEDVGNLKEMLPGKADWAKEAKFAKYKAKELNDMAKGEPNQRIAAGYMALARSLRESLKESARVGNSTKAYKLFEQADQFYKNKFSKLSQKFIRPFLRIGNEKNPQELYNLMKQGAQSDQKLLEKIIDIAGKSSVKPFLTTFFSSARDMKGDINIPVLLNLYKKIPQPQRDMLMSQKTQDMFKKLSNEWGNMKYPLSMLKNGAEKFYDRIKQAMLKDPRKLQELMNMAGPESKSILLKKYFSDAIRPDKTVNFNKLMSLYDQIPAAQKEMLFSPETMKKFEAFRQTRDLSKAAIDFMTRVQTGKVNQKTAGIIGRMFLAKKILTAAHLHMWHQAAYYGALMMAPGVMRKFIFDNPELIRKVAHSALPKGTSSLGTRGTSGATKIEQKIRQKQKYTPGIVIAASQAGGND